jgi:hypothetical protein
MANFNKSFHNSVETKPQETKYLLGLKTNKSRKDIIAEFIAVILFLFLTFAFKAACSDLHLSQEDKPKYNQIYKMDLLELVQSKNYITFENQMVKNSVEEISKNPIGSELLRLIVLRIEMYREIYKQDLLPIVIRDSSEDDNPDDCCIAKLHTYGGKAYGVSKIEINLNLKSYETSYPYNNREDKLIGFSKELIAKEKTYNLADTIFHELCHALHALEGTDEMYGRTNILNALVESGFYKNKIRKNYSKDDEEFRTISGIYMRNGKLYRDFISEYGYDLYKSYIYGTEFLPRVFHTVFDERGVAEFTLEDLLRMDYFVE